MHMVNTARHALLVVLFAAAVFLGIGSFILGCTEGSDVPTKRQEKALPPNFVIILADDLGFGDLGVFGAKDIRTPHLDRMADEGIRFTSFYVASSVCTPSRAALLTGCYPKRVGLDRGVLYPYDTKGLNPDEVTIAEILKAMGYATACIGKWHLGRPPELLPTRQGFDSYFGIPYSNDMGPDSLLSLLGGHFPPLPLIRDEEVIEEGVDQRTLTKRYTEEAISFIRTNRYQPFFLYLAHNMPHYPCHASEDFEDPAVDEHHRGIYASAVEEIDCGVGYVMDTLKLLGLEDRTLVVFTSDNGPWLIARTLFREPTGSAAPLRGWKSESFEGGMRVPAIMHWPGRLAAGRICDELVTALDLVPTMAAFAAADLPAGAAHEIDGKDISSLLENTDTVSPYTYFFYYSDTTGKLEAVRDREGWKLHMLRDLRMVNELYYLPDDIQEEHNLYSARPDIVCRLVRAALAFERGVSAEARPPGQAGMIQQKRADISLSGG